MISYIVSGLTLGFGAGISPGPLMTLVIAESLRGGWPAGFRVSLAPLFTDSLMIVAALLIIAPMPPWGLALIGLIGGAVMIWMGWGTIKASAPVVEEAAATGHAISPWAPLGKGILTNLLNPHAFLFWLTIGGPLVTEAHSGGGWSGTAALLAPFFAALIGCKLLLAFTVSSGRRFLQGPAYRRTLVVAGALLALFGVWQMWKGVAFF